MRALTHRETHRGDWKVSDHLPEKVSKYVVYLVHDAEPTAVLCETARSVVSGAGCRTARDEID